MKNRLDCLPCDSPYVPIVSRRTRSNVDVDAFYALVQEMAEIAEVNGETLSPQLQLIYKEV